MSEKLSLWFWEDQKTMREPKVFMKDVIVDRKSKYSVTAWLVRSQEEVENFIKELLCDNYFQKATHNSFAYRVQLENGAILESRQDDWESWAGNCILRELQRENIIDSIIIVTRYFGWVHLQNDRFKHVIDATKMILEKL